MTRRDPGLAVSQTTLKRPSLLVVALRWRHELWMTSALACVVSVISSVGVTLTLEVLGGLMALAGLVTTSPRVRCYTAARAWVIITPHRVRTCFAQSWVNNRAGRLPTVVRAKAEPFGERVLVWCQAGITFEDVASACDLLAAACWATEVIARRSSRYAHVVYLDVIRREQRQSGADAELDVPLPSRADTGVERPPLFRLPADHWHDAA